MFTVTQSSKKKFNHCHVNPLNAKLNIICHLLALLEARHIFHVSGLRINVIHMCIIAFCIHFSTIACCPYLTCSSVCNYSLHSGLFLSVLNIIHVLDLESVCLIPKIYIS